MGHAQHGKKLAQHDVSAGLFLRLAQRAFAHRFAQFHKARRQGPVAFARLNRALAQQHPAISGVGQRAHDQ